MPTRSRLLLAPRWLLLCSACATDSGTPTPEPPDHLPAPELVLPSSTLIETDTRSTPLPPATLQGRVGSGHDAWVVNLDAVAPLPQRVSADARGAFSVEIREARAGDRIRVVARTDTRHSPAADLEIVTGPSAAATFRTPASTTLDCLGIAPPDEITEVVTAEGSAQRAFLLDNRCEGAVQVTRAALLLGDQGFSIEPSAAAIPAGERASLRLTILGHARSSERADVVLLDVALGTRVGRYALGVYSVSASSIGKP